MSKATVDGFAGVEKWLTPAGRLRLAADLLERGRVVSAHAIAAPVVDELGAILAFCELRKGGPGGEP